MTRSTFHRMTSLDAAAAQLRAQKLGCLPVVENGQVVGIITKDDMLAALVRLLNESGAK